MDKVYKDIMVASTVEILTLPLFYVIGRAEGLAFWVALILLDSFLLKRIDVFKMIELLGNPQYKKEQRQLLFLQGLFVAGLLILAFHSLALAGALLLNDIVVDILCLINTMNEKKNK